MKKLSLILLLSLLPLSIFSQEENTLSFFFMEICPSCEDYILAEEYRSTILEIDRSPEWKANTYHMARPESGTKLKELLAENDLPDISRSLPLLLINDTYINGYEEIGVKLEEILTKIK